jgi:DnaK suppressor protein
MQNQRSTFLFGSNKMHEPLLALESRLAELTTALANREGLAASDTVADLLERTEDVQRRELTSDLIRMRDRERVEVLAAIQRVKDGTYGECEECGDQISAGRLRVLPCARLCITCQESAEKSGSLVAGA